MGRNYTKFLFSTLSISLALLNLANIMNAFVPDWKNDLLSKQEAELNLTFLGPESQATVLGHRKVVVCYVGTWAKYRTPPEEASYNISHIDPKLCTHLIYSFAGLNNMTFDMEPLDPWLDLYVEENGGGNDWYTRFNKLKESNSHLKVLLAVGGWNEGSEKYSKMAADPVKRSRFINSALDLIRKYGFDGLDLDWEFPGSRGGSSEDKHFFTVLVRELRHKFDKYGLMLTAAFGPYKATIHRAYELKKLTTLLDHFHIMSYDIHGSWDGFTSHNAPLYAPPDDNSVSECVDYFLSQGVPSYKLVLGVPFYGRTYLLTDPSEPNSALSSTSEKKGFEGPFTKEAGFLGYNEICNDLLANRGDWTTYWDGNAKVPYMRNGAKWVSFDNPDSIEEKIKFALSRDLRGAMIWSIDTDDFHGKCGSPNPLLKTINYVFSTDESANVIPTDDVPAKSFRVNPLLSTILILSTGLIIFA